MKPSVQSILLGFALAIFFLVNDASAQAKDSVVAKPRFIVIVDQKSGQSTKGVLHRIDNEAIDIMNFHDSIVHIMIPAEEVAAIRYRKNGKIRRHIGWGFLIGAAAGAIVGATTYEAHSCGFGFATCVERGVDPLTTTVLGGLLGAGTGALIGSRFKSIELEGDRKKYEAAISFFEQP